MSEYDLLQERLRASPKTWLVTGAAGFIGSNLVETLLKLDQHVVGYDNFSTGRESNFLQVQQCVDAGLWARFRLIKGDLTDRDVCLRACEGVDVVLHQGALGSVPRSIADPIATHRANVDGFINIISAACHEKVSRFVYASSSSVYGDHPGLPKIEEQTGKPLSPYAATKVMNEIYAGVFSRTYGIETVGLRYFNVFGPRQDPEGAYAAVIPRWIAALLNHQPVNINGDGLTSRDFCYVANAVQANLLAGATTSADAVNHVYNVAMNERTTLNELFRAIEAGLRARNPALPAQKPRHQDFRAGDVRHSLADITKARKLLGYEPTHHFAQGLEATLDWYCKNLPGPASA